MFARRQRQLRENAPLLIYRKKFALLSAKKAPKPPKGKDGNFVLEGFVSSKPHALAITGVLR